MPAGKIACRGLAGLLVGLSCLGCHSLAHHQAPPPPVQPPPPVLPPPVAVAPTPPPLSAQQADPGPLPGLVGAAIVAGPLESPPVFCSTPPLSPAVPIATADMTLASHARPLPTGDGRPAAPATPAAADPLRRLADQAAATYATIPGYTARLRQREQLAGKDKPEEVMDLKFRPQPWSVYFRWVGPEARGREVVYVQGRYEGKIHTRLAAGDAWLMPAGARFSISPDNPMARGRGRHPITEAGIGFLVQRFGQLVQSGGRLTYLGPLSRPEFAAPVEAVEQEIPPGAEAALPSGGRRQWFFAADSHLPVLISTRDGTGHEVEYYCYEQVRYPVQFTDEDFNPDHLWARR
jgi:hypothetical protein